MSAELLTDREIVGRLLGASDVLTEEELVAFAGMKNVLLRQGAALTNRQRQWCEEVFNREKLYAPAAKQRAVHRKVEVSVPYFWWEQPEYHPTKPPPGPSVPWRK